MPSLSAAVTGATLLVFVVPHQFLSRLFDDVKVGLGPALLDHGRVKAISLIKGAFAPPSVPRCSPSLRHVFQASTWSPVAASS